MNYIRIFQLLSKYGALLTKVGPFIIPVIHIAEAALGRGTGAEKKAKVIEILIALKSANISIGEFDDAEIDAFIDAVVAAMNLIGDLPHH